MRKLLSILLFAIFFFLPVTVNAANPTYITVTNPVRGREGWQQLGQDPLDLPNFQYQESTPSAIPITWLLRFDAVNDASISAYFANLSQKDRLQSIGAFLEITPNMDWMLSLEYPKGNSIFNANRIFLSGYTPENRIRLIDLYMSSFFERFGTYPKVVGAWHLDSFSLRYLRDKYSVVAAMNCDDQYSTDSYRLWGGYLGSPYFPSINNSLVPADAESDRIDLVMFRWAQRDLFNFYNQTHNSLYSVQLNDYTKLGLTNMYFEKLLDQYSGSLTNDFTHINIGLENDDSLSKYRRGITQMYQTIAKKTKDQGVIVTNLDFVAERILRMYPLTSPIYSYTSFDPIGISQEKTFWIFTPKYRLEMISDKDQARVIDFRIYNQSIYEDYYSTPNTSTTLYYETPSVIDTVKFPESAVKLDIKLSSAQTTRDHNTITLTDGSKMIIFSEKTISFVGLKPSFQNNRDMYIGQKGDTQTINISPITPFKPSVSHLVLFIALALFFIVIFLKKKPILSLGILLSSLWGIVVVRSGDLYSFGLGVWGPNGHDAIFHLSLINHFAHNFFDLSHPQISGVVLSNYHFIFDYFSGVICGIFNLSPVIYYFVLFPIFSIVTICLLIDKLTLLWGYGKYQRLLAIFITILTGSFGYIPAYISGNSIFNGESAFWANQSISILLNPPFTLSIILLLGFLILFEKQAKLSKKITIPLVVVGSLLAQTKVYGFILLISSLILTGEISLFVGILLFGGLITLPFSRSTGFPFEFNPLWFTKSLFASSDRVWWPRLSQAWQTYEYSSNIPKLLAVNLFALIVFIVGNLGIRILAVIRILTRVEIKKSEKLAVCISMLGVVVPLVFVQKLNPWNTIQFTYYSLFFFGIISAKVIGDLVSRLKNIWLKIIVLSIILTISLPTTVGTLRDYVQANSSSRLSYTELQALDLLKNSPRGIVLAPLFSENDSSAVASPKPFYSYVSTAYISAFTGQPEFLADTINLEITGFNYHERANQIQRFYNTKDATWAKEFLTQNNILYVYTTRLKNFALSKEELCLTKIFDSGEINLYKFNCHGQN